MRTSDFDPLSIEIFTKQLKRAMLLVLVIFGILILRLWYLQVVGGTVYRNKSEQNRIQIEEIAPFRGMIFDRKGRLLAGNRPRYDLHVIPEGIQNRGELLAELGRMIGLNAEEAEKKMAKTARRYPFKPICLKRDISRDELAVVETHRFNLPGVMITVSPQRHYVSGGLASHVLGYLGEIGKHQLKRKLYENNKPGDFIGKSGVERKWQSFLQGIRGGEQREVDAAGRKIRVISLKSPLPGANVHLSIDKNLQILAEKALKGKKGAIVALDPNDGQVLALASSPAFDPNVFVGGIDKKKWERISSSKRFPLQNRVLTGQYPPGSVFKIVVALAGLEEGVIDPDEEISCRGVYSFWGHEFHCWKEHGHGAVSFHRALKESCDIYFYTIGKRLGIDRIAKYARRLGLGRPTVFDAGREKAGLIPSSAWKLRRFGVPWQQGETLSASIGQSFVLVTPIQMATMISAVFNGGVLYEPRVTLWVGKTKSDKVYHFSPKVRGKAKIRRQSLERVKKALVGVVNEAHGTGSKARLDQVTVAGKTGTAQVVTLEKEKQLGEAGDIPQQFRDHAWFVAVAPAERPRIALAIVVEHGGHGGSAAAPIAKILIQAFLREMG